MTPPRCPQRAGALAWRRALLAALLPLLLLGLLAPPADVLTARAEAQPRRRAAKQRTVKVEINSITEGATVSIDGEPVGTIPLPGPVEVTPGEHVIQVALRGYIDYYETHNLKPSRRPVVIEADLLPWAGVLIIDTTPAGAQVLIDGRLLGETPFDGEVEAGLRQLTLQSPGYLAWHEQRSVVAGVTERLDLRLELEPPPVEDTPFYTTWWFWTGVAAVLAGGTAAAFVLSGDEPAPAQTAPVDGSVRLNLLPF